MKKMLLILLLALLIMPNVANAATNITACGTLSSAGTYVLNQSLNSSGTCITIGSNNITLDGAGYTINYSRSAVGYAINNTGGYDNLFVKNLSILQGNSTPSNSYAIYLGSYYDVTLNNTFTNNTIVTSGAYAYGFFLYPNSDNNTLSNNTIITSGAQGYGFKLSAGSDYNFISNNIIMTTGTWGIGIYPSVSTYNVFSQNNITTSGANGRGIYIANAPDNYNTISLNNIITALGTGLSFDSSNFNNVSDNNIQRTSNSSSDGIGLSNSNSSTFFNNNVTLTSSVSASAFGFGIYAGSNYNTLNENNILTSNINGYALALDSSSNNNITGGSFISTKSADYSLVNASRTNNIINTNFTASRAIYFNDIDSWFNYNNETNGNIWLNTNVSVAQKNITRILLSATQANMSWNDTASATLTASYNFSGLFPNFNYNITNGSSEQIIKTDSYGNLGTQINLSNGIQTTISAKAINPISTCQTINIDGTYTLTQNIDADGTCITIGINDITIDGAGYQINYSRTGLGYAVLDTAGYDNITIKNLNIVQGSTTADSHAVYVGGLVNATIVNNSIKTAGGGAFGLLLDNLNNNMNISGNTINTTGTYGYGAYLWGSDNNSIKNNTIVTGDSNAYGLLIYGSDGVNIIQNNINAVSHGILLDSGSTLNNISLNNVTSSAAYGIYLYTSGTNNVSFNTITTGTQNYGYGIDAFTSANNTISSNNIVTTGQWGYGIILDTNGGSNIVSDNNITTSGIVGEGLYIFKSTDNSISRNNVITQADSSMACVVDLGHRNTFVNNTFNATSTNSFAVDILHSWNNTFTGGSFLSSLYRTFFLRNVSDNTNFTNTQVSNNMLIEFYDTDSWFNYNNQSSGNIWLKTNVSGATAINRTLVTWSQSTMKWNDTNSTAAITANYIINNLNASKTYHIYNTSNSTQTKTYNILTDASGALNFTIALNNNTEISVEQNAVPTATVSISPSPASIGQDLSCLYTYSDSDNDAELGQWFQWYINDIANETTQNLSAGNISMSDRVICSVKVFDGFENGSFTNSSELVIGDVLSPSLHNDYLSGSSGFTNNVMNVFVNITEANTMNWVYAEIQDPNQVKSNLTMAQESHVGAEYKYNVSYTPTIAGVYHFVMWGRDGSSNIGSLISNLTYSATVYVPPVVGGGGGTTVITQCGNKVCEINENNKTCPVDCAAKFVLLDAQTDTELRKISLSGYFSSAYTYEFRIRNTGDDDLTMTFISNVKWLKFDLGGSKLQNFTTIFRKRGATDSGISYIRLVADPILNKSEIINTTFTISDGKTTYEMPLEVSRKEFVFSNNVSEALAYVMKSGKAPAFGWVAPKTFAGHQIYVPILAAAFLVALIVVAKAGKPRDSMDSLITLFTFLFVFMLILALLVLISPNASVVQSDGAVNFAYLVLMVIGAIVIVKGA